MYKRQVPECLLRESSSRVTSVVSTNAPRPRNRADVRSTNSRVSDNFLNCSREYVPKCCLQESYGVSGLHVWLSMCIGVYMIQSPDAFNLANAMINDMKRNPQAFQNLKYIKKGSGIEKFNELYPNWHTKYEIQIKRVGHFEQKKLFDDSKSRYYVAFLKERCGEIPVCYSCAIDVKKKHLMDCFNSTIYEWNMEAWNTRFRDTKTYDDVCGYEVVVIHNTP